MSKASCFAAVAVTVVCATVARAHGPQLQLTAEAGKIVTHEILVDEYHPLSATKSIYALPVASVSSEWLVQPPGTSGSGPGIAPGVGFVDEASHPFKFGGPYYATSFTDGLLKWNGATFVDAGAAQLQMYKTVSGVPQTTTTVDGAGAAGFAYSISLAGGSEGPENSHTGMGFRFLGDGATATSPLADGVYLATLKVTHSPPGGAVLESDPFYFLLAKGAAPGSVGSAAQALAAQRGFAPGAIQAMTPTPEPAALAMAVAAFVAATSARRAGLRREA